MNSDGTASELQSFIDGQRIKGYPTEGIGSNNDRNAFIGYEKSGTSLEKPFTAELSFPTNEESYFKWSRLWDGHVEIKHTADPGSPIGSAGEGSLLSHISLYTYGGGEKRAVKRVQLGDPRTPDNRFQFASSPVNGLDPTASSQEEYRGLYGIQWVTINGEPTPGTCKMGRFQVETMQPIVFESLPDDETFLGLSAEPVTGGVLMNDDFGNEATVTYDGMGNTMTVALNNGPSRTYTYEEVQQLLEANCGAKRIDSQ